MRPSACLLLVISCLTVGCEKSRSMNRDEPNRQLEAGAVAVTAPESTLAVTAPPPREVNPAATRAALAALKAHQGEDLRRVEESQAKALQGAITKLIPTRTYRDYGDFSPWYVWDFGREGRQSRNLLFEADDTGAHPGYTRIRLTLLAEPGGVVLESTFGTGWRCYLRDVKLEPAKDGGHPIIALVTGPGTLGPNVSKQYYANIGDRFDLVRLEDSAGRATRNSYYVRHLRCGPTLPTQTEAEWVADLLADDRLRLLRVLVWLGGTHWDLKPDDKADRQHEEFGDIRLVRKVRADKKVILRLKELTMSVDRWVREAALLAGNPKDGRF